MNFFRRIPTSFELYLDGGRISIDKCPAERELRFIGLGRRKWDFAGLSSGGRNRARAMT
ncbi:transposase [Salipiger sp. H15]|uniref:IS66 family transposase n=1 Tax=Alloyangia sp. H15 TaxID=3029062 RepID=UPI0033652E64